MKHIYPYIYLFVFAVFCAAAAAFGETPEKIFRAVSEKFKNPAKKSSLEDEIASAKRRKKSMSEQIAKIRTLLEDTGRKKFFAALTAASFALAAASAPLSSVLHNPYILPDLVLLFVSLPVVYLVSLSEKHRAKTEKYLDIYLSSIASAYVDNNNFVASVRARVPDMRGRVKKVFSEFLDYIDNVNPSIEDGIRDMREKIDDRIFKDFCDAVVLCQRDGDLRSTLGPVTDRYKDVIAVNDKIRTMTEAIKREYFVMVAMVVGNIPLLYFLDKSFYAALMYTAAGKAVLAVVFFVILLTFWRSVKLLRRIGY